MVWDALPLLFFLWSYIIVLSNHIHIHIPVFPFLREVRLCCLEGAFCEWRQRSVSHKSSVPFAALSAFQAVRFFVYFICQCILKVPNVQVANVFLPTLVIQQIISCCRPDKVEIGKVMKLDQVKGVISSSLFSWDLYSGSHEGKTKSLWQLVA